MSRSYQPCLRAIRNLGERALPVGASIVSRANVNLNILFIELPGEHGSRRHRRLRARGRLFVKRRDLRFGPKAPFWQSVADFRSTLAGSTGRRNTGIKSLCWRFKLQGLTWSLV